MDGESFTSISDFIARSESFQKIKNAKEDGIDAFERIRKDIESNKPELYRFIIKNYFNFMRLLDKSSYLDEQPDFIFEQNTNNVQGLIR